MTTSLFPIHRSQPSSSERPDQCCVIFWLCDRRLGNSIRQLADGIGFDPFLGFYHVIEYGRPSLALDLLEEYRHELVDRLALNLFNLNIVQEEDFDKFPKEGVYLGLSGKKKFFAQYEKMMGDFTSDTDTATKKTGFRAQIQNRISEFARLVRSDRQPTSPAPFAEDFEDI